MSDQTIKWKRLRLKPNTTDDADWRGTQVSPHTLTAVVGGAASNGVYSIRILGEVIMMDGGRIEVDVLASFDRQAAETNDQIAGELEDDFDASAVLRKAGIVADVAASTITITFPPGANLRLIGTAPGAGTITFPLGSLMPIMASAPVYAGSRHPLGNVMIQVSAMDDVAGTILLAPGTGAQTTFSLEMVELSVVEVKDPVTGLISLLTRVTGMQTPLAAQNLNREIPLSIRGAGFWTVRLHTFANAVAGTEAYEVTWREAAT